MKKFIITGCPRSGTTYLSSILNSNQKIACVEYKIFNLINLKFKYKEEFELFYNELDAFLMLVGMPEPKILKTANSEKNLIELFLKYLLSTFKTKYIGFKCTNLDKKKIIYLLKNNYKIIYLNRDAKSLLSSQLKRISTDIDICTTNIIESMGILKNKDFTKSKNFLIINHEDLIRCERKTLKTISTFLKTPIKKKKFLYHSFLKYRGKKIFRQNSSYKKFTGKLMRNLLKKYPVNEIEKYSNIINNNKSFFSIKGFLKNLIFRHRQLLLKIFR